MLISFTGAQSSGKTTLLRECKNLYQQPEWNYVDEVTRKVKREGHSINLDGNDITQLFILNEHLNNHVNNKNSIMDRCILDGYVYTSCLSRRGKVSDWVTRYACDLMNLLIDRLDIIFYTQPEDVPLIDDGTRSVDREFRQDIINRYEDLFAQDYYWMDKLVRLSGTVDDRMETIQFTINEHSNTRQQQNIETSWANV
jgi:nicotinamide riboside kinase